MAAATVPPRSPADQPTPRAPRTCPGFVRAILDAVEGIIALQEDRGRRRAEAARERQPAGETRA